MKNCMTKRALTLLLVVAMLVATCVTSTASAVDLKDTAHADVVVQESQTSQLSDAAVSVENPVGEAAPEAAAPVVDAEAPAASAPAATVSTGAAASATASGSVSQAQNTSAATTGTLSSGTLTGSVDASIPQADALANGAYFSLGMSAAVNADDSSIIDVTVTVKDIQEQLDAVEFLLKFDPSKVAGVITESGAEMDAFMTVKPTYTFQISGMELPASRYEQACVYDAANGLYECRFIDLLSYPNAKPGETYNGLINDGDLVITIQFKTLSSVKAGDVLSFSATDVLGTTREDMNSVPGADGSAQCTAKVGGSGSGDDSGDDPGSGTTPSGDAFNLDIEVPSTVTVGGQLDVVVTIKNIKTELDALEFYLDFDQSKLTPVITETGTAMDELLTVVPQYTFKVGTTEVLTSRYEQACKLDATNGIYECRFMDLMQYTNAKPGETYQGLINDGDLVITIPFMLKDAATAGTDLSFSMVPGSVKGTTRGDLVGVLGNADTAVSSVIAAHTHTWVDATCTDPKTCSGCGATEGEAVGHQWTDSNCTTPKTCSVCKITSGPPKGHQWAMATCDQPMTCTTCGATNGQANGHTWIDATCTEAKTCSTCGATEGTAPGHQWLDATCTTAKTCSVCKATSGPPKGHKWVMATCEAPMTCSTCGTTNGEPTDHTWTDATCTEAKTCSVCGATEGTALGHSWTAASCTSPKTCSVCKATDGNVSDHAWNEATCTTPKTCAACGATEGEAAGHQWVDATCTTAKTCSVCKITNGPPKGHMWVAATCTSAATCSTCGAVDGEPKGHQFSNGSCTVCGAADTSTGTISGTLTSYLSTTEPVTITLTLSGSDTPAHTTTLAAGAADYSISGIAQGTYTMSVSKANHVTRDYTVTVGAGTASVDVKILPIGDTTGDGRVNISDVSRLYAHVRKTNLITDEYLLKCADILVDTRVNIGDVSRLYSHIRGINKLF